MTKNKDLHDLHLHPSGMETCSLGVDMCNTPTYCVLEKAAKDIFNKGYGFGMVIKDLRTNSCNRVEFSTSGHIYTNTGKESIRQLRDRKVSMFTTMHSFT